MTNPPDNLPSDLPGYRRTRNGFFKLDNLRPVPEPDDGGVEVAFNAAALNSELTDGQAREGRQPVGVANEHPADHRHCARSNSRGGTQRDSIKLGRWDT